MPENLQEKDETEKDETEKDGDSDLRLKAKRMLELSTDDQSTNAIGSRGIKKKNKKKMIKVSA